MMIRPSTTILPTLFAFCLLACAGGEPGVDPAVAAADALDGNGFRAPRNLGYVLVAHDSASGLMFARTASSRERLVAYVFYGLRGNTLEVQADNAISLSIESMSGAGWVQQLPPVQYATATTFTPPQNGVYRVVLQRLPTQVTQLRVRAAMANRQCILGSTFAPNDGEGSDIASYRLGPVPVESSGIYLHDAVILQYLRYSRWGEGNPLVVPTAERIATTLLYTRSVNGFGPRTLEIGSYPAGVPRHFTSRLEDLMASQSDGDSYRYASAVGSDGNPYSVEYHTPVPNAGRFGLVYPQGFIVPVLAVENDAVVGCAN